MVQYGVIFCLTKGHSYNVESAKVREILEDTFFTEEKKADNQPHFEDICCSVENEKGM